MKALAALFVGVVTGFATLTATANPSSAAVQPNKGFKAYPFGKSTSGDMTGASGWLFMGDYTIPNELMRGGRAWCVDPLRSSPDNQDINYSKSTIQGHTAINSTLGTNISKIQSDMLSWLSTSDYLTQLSARPNWQFSPAVTSGAFKLLVYQTLGREYYGHPFDIDIMSGVDVGVVGDPDGKIGSEILAAAKSLRAWGTERAAAYPLPLKIKEMTLSNAEPGVGKQMTRTWQVLASNDKAVPDVYVRIVEDKSTPDSVMHYQLPRDSTGKLAALTKIDGTFPVTFIPSSLAPEFKIAVEFSGAGELQLGIPQNESSAKPSQRAIMPSWGQGISTWSHTPIPPSSSTSSTTSSTSSTTTTTSTTTVPDTSTSTSSTTSSTSSTTSSTSSTTSSTSTTSSSSSTSSTSTTSTTHKPMPTLNATIACPTGADSDVYPVTVAIKDSEVGNHYAVSVDGNSSVATRIGNEYVAVLNVSGDVGDLLKVSVTGGRFGTSTARTSVTIPHDCVTTTLSLPSVTAISGCAPISGAPFPVEVTISDPQQGQAYKIRLGVATVDAQYANGAYKATLQVMGSPRQNIGLEITGGKFGTTGHQLSFSLGDLCPAPTTTTTILPVVQTPVVVSGTTLARTGSQAGNFALAGGVSLLAGLSTLIVIQMLDRRRIRMAR